MAYSELQLSKLGNVKPATGRRNDRQIWHYEAGADNLAAVVTNGYFNSARGLLEVGDRIHLVCNNEADFRVLKVTAVPKITGNVTTAALAGYTAP